MNNFLESVDSTSNRSQILDEHQKDSDHRSETPRRSSKQLVDRDLVTANENESNANKLPGDIKDDVSVCLRDELKTADDQGNANVINVEKSSPTQSDNTNTAPNLENEETSDTTVDNQAITDLNEQDGSVVC